MVEESREQIAEAYGARPSEVVFTSGGTEADNLAVKGLYWVRRSASPRRRKVLITAIEHHAVLDPAQWLAATKRRRCAGSRSTRACCRRTRCGLPSPPIPVPWR